MCAFFKNYPSFFSYLPTFGKPCMNYAFSVVALLYHAKRNSKVLHFTNLGFLGIVKLKGF